MSTKNEVVIELSKVLKDINLPILAINMIKQKQIKATNGWISIKKFKELLLQKIGTDISKYPLIVPSFLSDNAFFNLVESYGFYLDDLKIAKGEDPNAVDYFIPPELEHLKLCIDAEDQSADLASYYCISKDGFYVKEVSGATYIKKSGIKDPANLAEMTNIRYIPKGGVGLLPPVEGGVVKIFNKYIPPEWVLKSNTNITDYNKWIIGRRFREKGLPQNIYNLIHHIFPIKEDREFFYAWVYTSLTSRAYVYLVLCGEPGVGKNRIKLLLRALHGVSNTVDGRKETFGFNQNKFNTQMENNTLMWFDELKYGPEMEPRMKEYQNDSISIEKKGVDATQATKIFSNMVISNNYLRDNYILFNSRKFVPLKLGNTSLDKVMSSEDIDSMSRMLDPSDELFDPIYIKKIYRIIFKLGRKYVRKYPNLEYKSPMYWELAHACMSRWQKIAVASLLTKTNRGMFPGWDENKKAFLWSKVEENLKRKKEYGNTDYRDFSTVKSFFDTYRDGEGNKVFETESIKNDIMQDFWITPDYNSIIDLNKNALVSLNSLKVPSNVKPTNAVKTILKSERDLKIEATEIAYKKKKYLRQDIKPDSEIEKKLIKRDRKKEFESRDNKKIKNKQSPRRVRV